MKEDELVLEKFYDIISESKQEMFDKIAADRTRFVTVVLETIMKEHNASAVLRTCDCFGIQDLNLIEPNTTYEIQREIARGASNWVDIHAYASSSPTIDCLSHLKEKGYHLVATSPHATKDINDLPVDKPIALIFGTEKDGITKEAQDLADDLYKIPMYGFTESYNISVSAAIILNILRNKLENSTINWKLSEVEQTKLKIDWCTKIVNNGPNVEREIRKRIVAKKQF